MAPLIFLPEELIAPLFATEWGRRTGLALLAVMALLVLYNVVAMPLAWYADSQLAHAPHAVATQPSALDHERMLSKKIPDRHLFGIGPGGQGGSTLPITSLQLHLVGVVKATPDSLSRVIISESNQTGKVYQIGDQLSSGVKVYAIADDGVILQNGERLEKLPLQRPALIFQGPPKKLLQEE